MIFDRREPLCEMWDDADVEEETPAPVVEEAPADPAAAAAEPAEAETPTPEAPVLGYEPKKLICKHWIRYGPFSTFTNLTSIFKENIDMTLRRSI